MEVRKRKQRGVRHSQHSTMELFFGAREYSPTFEKIEFDVLVVHDFN